MLQAQKQTLDRLKALRSQAQQLLHQNEQASQREQLPHGDMVVDVAGMGRLKALGDARVEALREGILRAGLEQALIWERLKELGWDSMEEHQAILTGIKSRLEVCPPSSPPRTPPPPPPPFPHLPPIIMAQAKDNLGFIMSFFELMPSKVTVFVFTK